MKTTTLTQIDAAIATKVATLDTYEGMAAQYDGESEYTAHIALVFDRIDDIKVEIAALEAQYNHELAVLEGDA